MMEHIDQQKLNWAIEEWGPEAVQMAMDLVTVSDPDGAYVLLEDHGMFDAAEVIEFLYFDQD
jgi:hypothetical protein